MPRPKTVPDHEVLLAARAVFLEHGAQAPTSLVAARAGIAQATLFQRYGDKPSLLLAALALDPIDPERIVGPADEPERLGRAAHLGALATRLLGEMILVVSVSEVAGSGRTLHPDLVERLHAAPGIEALVTRLGEHMAGLGLPEPWQVHALLLMVHGAAFMAAHSNEDDRAAVAVSLAMTVEKTFAGGSEENG